MMETTAKDVLEHTHPSAGDARSSGPGGAEVKIPAASNSLATLYAQIRDAHCHFLTPLEGDVLSLMYQGLDNAEIAHRMGCSDATVRRHVGDIAHKVFETTDVPPKRERLVAWIPEHFSCCTRGVQELIKNARKLAR
jgi:DNA-binding NarL/FixJ family response regulator